MTNLGGNSFANVKYPLLLVDRFFRFTFDLASASFGWDVFRWNADTGDITYEVKGGQPQAEGIDRSPNGTVVVAAQDGGFAYKIRSGRRGRSELFGRIPAGEEFTVRVTDNALTVLRGGDEVMTVQSSQVSGFPVGLRITPDGTMQLGTQLPDGFVPPAEPTYKMRPN